MALLKRMCVDRERVLATRVSSATELADLHRATFRGSLDLMLIAADSPLRAIDVPSWSRRWAGVPRCAISTTICRTGSSTCRGRSRRPRRRKVGTAAPAAWRATRAVREWLDAERARGRTLLDKADARWPRSRDSEVFRCCGGLRARCGDTPDVKVRSRPIYWRCHARISSNSFAMSRSACAYTVRMDSAAKSASLHGVSDAFHRRACEPRSVPWPAISTRQTIACWC